MGDSSTTAKAVIAARRLVLPCVLAVVLLLSACAELSPQAERGKHAILTPETPAEYVLSVTALYAWVGNTTAKLLRQHTITIERAKEVQAYLDTIRPQLDAARRTVAEVTACHEDDVPICMTLKGSLTVKLLKQWRGELLDYQHKLQRRLADES